jgi:hypothetical protein
MLYITSVCSNTEFWKFYYEFLHAFKIFRLWRISFNPFSIRCWTVAALLTTGAHITFEVVLNNNEIWDAHEAHLAREVTSLNRSQWCSGWRRPGVPPNGADRRRTVDMRWLLLTAPTASLNDATHFMMLHVCHDTSNNTSFTSFLLVIWMQRILFIAGLLALERTTSLLRGSRISRYYCVCVSKCTHTLHNLYSTLFQVSTFSCLCFNHDPSTIGCCC